METMLEGKVVPDARLLKGVVVVKSMNCSKYRNADLAFSSFLHQQLRWDEVRITPSAYRSAVHSSNRNFLLPLIQSSEINVNPEESSGLTPTTVWLPPSSVSSISLSETVTSED